MRFAPATGLWVEGKQKRVLSAKCVSDSGTERASCKVLPLGNMSVGWTFSASLSAASPTPVFTLPFTCNGHETHRFTPTAVEGVYTQAEYGSKRDEEKTAGISFSENEPGKEGSV